MSPAKKKKKAAPKKLKPPPKEVAVVVPLLPSPGLTPPPAPTPAPQPKQKFRIWYLLQATTIGGLFLIGLGTMGFIFYLTTDKEHKPETAVLWISVVFIAAGFHFVSRQSVRNFINDFGKFVPWGKKNGDTEETKAAPPEGGGGV